MSKAKGRQKEAAEQTVVEEAPVVAEEASEESNGPMLIGKLEVIHLLIH